MGIRYRKSINLGNGFRVNISKSGIGYSWGVKGARFTRTARGTFRTTYSIPGTGLSYVDEKSLKKNNGNKNISQQKEIEEVGESTDIVNFTGLQSEEYSAFLKRIKTIRNLNHFSTFLICLLLYFYFPIFFVLGIIGIGLKVYIHKKMSINMEYEFEDGMQRAYDDAVKDWLNLSKCQNVWQIVYKRKNDKKTNAGTNNTGVTEKAKIISKTPFFIRQNINVFGIGLGKQQVYFLPDKLLIVSGGKVVAINNADLKVKVSIKRYVEEYSVPKDSKVVDKKWKYVNKDGSPDKRYADNKQIPVCEYGYIVITSNSDLHLEILFSNGELAIPLRESLSKLYN